MYSWTDAHCSTTDALESCALHNPYQRTRLPWNLGRDKGDEDEVPIFENLKGNRYTSIWENTSRRNPQMYYDLWKWELETLKSIHLHICTKTFFWG